MPVLSSLTVPRTQKARGIKELMTNTQLQTVVPGARMPRVGEYYLIQLGDEEDHIRFNKWWRDREEYWKRVGASMKMFARPCPTKPAHGFVDSRVVDNLEQIIGIMDETKAEDPNGEILIVPFIEADINAVIVPQSGVITLGRGHDGATSGGKGVLNLFVVPDSMYGLQETLKNAGIGESEHAFFEVVRRDKDQPSVVQVRAGSPLPSSPNYIPRKVKVEEILTIEGQPSLLQYAKQIKALEERDGVVVVLKDHGVGSHYALHCIEHEIPVLCMPKEMPKIGDELEQTDEKAEFNEAEFAIGYRVAERTEVGDGLRLAIAIIHNAAKLRSSELWSRLCGFATAMIFKGTATACLGELRHYRGKGGISRSTVYVSHRHTRLEWLNKLLIPAAEKFMHYRAWTGKAGYGGVKWAMAAVQAITVFNRISEGNHEAAFTEANSLLNYAHNGGWLLNKFILEDVMHDAAAHPATAFLTVLDKVMRLAELDPSTTLFPPKFWNKMRPRKVRTSPKWEVNEVWVGPRKGSCKCFHCRDECAGINHASWNCYPGCLRSINEFSYQFTLIVNWMHFIPLKKSPEHMEFVRKMAVEV